MSWVKLGCFPEMTVEQARSEAHKVLGKFASGANPAAARRAVRQEPTFDAMLSEMLEKKRKRNGAHITERTKKTTSIPRGFTWDQQLTPNWAVAGAECNRRGVVLGTGWLNHDRRFRCSAGYGRHDILQFGVVCHDVVLDSILNGTFADLIEELTSALNPGLLDIPQPQRGHANQGGSWTSRKTLSISSKT